MIKKIYVLTILLVSIFCLQNQSAFGQCSVGAEPATFNAPTCSGQNYLFGTGAYKLFTISATTYYDWSWTNNTYNNGFCGTTQNGSGSSGNWTATTTAQNGWYSGTTTSMVISSNRTSTPALGTWASNLSSATLTYKISNPPTPGQPTITGVGCTAFTINWTATGTTTTYLVDVSLASNFSANISGWNANSVGNVTSVTVSGLAANTPYYVRIRASNNLLCNSGYSTSNSTTTLVQPTTTAPGSYTVCPGGAATMTSTGSGGTGLTYQWQYNNGGSWGNVVNSTPAGLIYGNPTTASMTLTSTNGTTPAGAYQYRCIVTSGGTGCNAATSTTGTLTVNGQTTITASPSSSTVCTGGGASMGVTVSGGITVGYQWQYNNSGTWGNVNNGTPAGINYTGNTTASLAITTTGGTTPAGAYQYRCVVTDGGTGCTSTQNSGAGTLTVNAQTTITASPGNSTVCPGGGASMGVTVTGGISVGYQWQYNNSGTWGSVVNGTPAGVNYTGNTSNSLGITSTNSTTPAGAYQYRCVVTDGGTGCTASQNSGTGILTVNAQPTVSSNPANSTFCPGGSASMAVSVSGGITVGYQWQYYNTGTSSWGSVANSTPAGVNYSGNTTNTLAITTTNPTTPTGGYQYRCIVTDAGTGCTASQTSGTGLMIIDAMPAVTTPTGTSICMGGNTALAVTAYNGVTLSQQWQYYNGSSWANVTNSTPAGVTYSGNTSMTLNISTTNGTTPAGSYQYQCVVTSTGSNCTTATSGSATVVVNPLPSITSNPVSSSVCPGGVTSMTVAATGGVTLSPSWYYYNGGSWVAVVNGTPSGVNYAGNTTNTLNITTTNGTTTAGTYQYEAIVQSTGSGCTTAPPAPANMVVNAQPTVSNPSGSTICQGGTASMSVTASGGVSLSEQWQYYNGSAWVNVANGSPAGVTYTGATSTTLNITTTNGTTPAGIYQYQCIVTSTGSGCNTVTSGSANLTVNNTPSVSTPGSPSICPGGSANLSVASSGGISLSQQWQYYNGSAWVNVANGTPTGVTYTGANNNSLAVATTLGTTNPGGYLYQCIVSSTGSGCTAATSGSGTVTVNAQPTISSPGGASICPGGTTTMNVITSGGVSLTPQWQYYNGSTFVNVSNGTPAGITYVGTNSNNLTINTTNGTTLAGTNQYQCVVTSSGVGCNVATSGSANLVVNAQPSVSSPSSSSICPGGSTTMSVTTSGGVTVSYQWQYYNGSSWSNVANGTPTGVTYTNANNATMNIATNSGTTPGGVYQYQCIVTSTGSGCNSTTSGTATMTINNQPSVSTPGTYSICPGGTQAMGVGVSGGVFLSEQWQYYNGSAWVNVANGAPTGVTYSGVNSTSLSITTTNGTTPPGSYPYQCYVTSTGSGCNSATSGSATLNVNGQPASSTPANVGICPGGATSMSVTLSGGVSTTPQWQYFDGSSWSNVANSTPAGISYVGATSTSLAIFSTSGTTPVGAYQYRVTASSSGFGCNSSSSSAGTLTVNAQPSVSTPSGSNVCLGGSGTIAVTTAGGVTLSSQWQYYNGSSWGNVTSGVPAGVTYTGSTSNSLGITTTNGTTSTGNYQYQVVITPTGSGCNAVTSSSATIAVTPNPQGSLTGNTVCNGGTGQLTFTATSGTGPFTVVYNDGTANRTQNNVVSGVAFNPSTNPTSTTSYTLVSVTDAYSCPRTSGFTGGTATVTVRPLPQGSIIGNTVCNGGISTLTFNATAGTGPFVIVYHDPSTFTYTQTNVISGKSWRTLPIVTTTYTVDTITDANGCIRTTGITGPNGTDVINASPQGVLTGNTINCGGGTGAQLTFTSVAGVSPFTVVYNDGVANRTVNNVTSGTPFNVFTNPAATTNYTLVSIVDVNTCSRNSGFTLGTGTVTVTHPAPNISATLEPISSIITAALRDHVQVTASGGPQPYTFVSLTADSLAVSSATSPIWYALSNGATHQFKVTDGNSCSSTVSIVTNTSPINIPSVVAKHTSSGIIAGINTWAFFRETAYPQYVLGAVNDNGNNLGNVTISSYLESTPPKIISSSSQYYCPNASVAAMQRHFVIQSDNAPTTPVNVRLYFSPSDLSSLIASANASSTNVCDHLGGLPNSSINDLYVTKYSGTNEDSTFSNNSPSGIYRVYGSPTSLPNSHYYGPLTRSTSGFDTDFGTSTSNSYIQFTAPEFSEIWIHGSQDGAPLPVEMVSFEATAVGNSYIRLDWTTATEINNKGFHVERSTDGINFTEIGWVDGHNNSSITLNYSFNDKNVLVNTKYYYRLTQEDNDGKTKTTDIVSASINGTAGTIVSNLFPNPAMDKVNIYILMVKEDDVTLDIYNVLGAKVQSITQHLNKGQNPAVQLDTHSLSAGTYTVTINTSNEVYTKKLMIAR